MLLIWCSVLVIVLYGNPLQAKYVPHSCNLGEENVSLRTGYYFGYEQNLTFQESERLQHKLINAAIIILATEKLGYTNVMMTVPEPGSLELNLNEFNRYTKQPDKMWPDAVINMEMLVPLGYSLNASVKNIGLSNTSTQYRWWLHSPPSDNGACALARHLSFYTDSKLIHECYLNKTFLSTSVPVLTNYIVNYDYCKSGNCPVVLSTNEDEIPFLKEHIKLLKINLSIIWVGNKLDSVIKDLRKTDHSFFIVDSISWNDKSTVAVTVSCEQFERHANCPYDKITYSKIVFSSLHLLNKLYSLIENFTLNDQGDSLISEYRSQILKTNDSQQAIESAACSWLKSQKKTEHYEKWFHNKQPEIMVTLLYCENDPSHNILHEIMNTAVNYINNKNILEGTYELQMSYRVVNCQKYIESMNMLREFFDTLLTPDIHKKLAGFIMPAVPQIIDIAMRLTRFYGTPVFTFNSEGPTLANRERYRHAFRTVGEKANLNKAYLKLFSQYKWKRVAAVSGYKQNNVDFISLLREYLLKNSDVKLELEKITEKDAKSSIKTALKKLQNANARIILVDVNLEEIKELLLTAYELNMLPSQGYVWLLPDWAPSLHAELDNFDSNQANIIKQVLDGHFYLKFSSLSDEPVGDNFIDNFRHILQANSSNSGDDYSNAGYVVDAIWTIALSVKRLIENHAGAEDDIHGTIYTLSDYIAKQKFKGVTGNIEFYEGSIKTSFIEINQWIDNESAFKINMISKIKVNADNDDTEWISKNPPQWRTVNKIVPGDGSTHCFFAQDTNEFYTNCNDILIFGALAAIIIIVTIFIIVAMFGLRRHRNRINLLLDVLSKTNNTTALINRLHSYEVPRDNIDMEWEIGKGSFGKVYGGYLKMDDDTWNKVAIKILKSDATGQNELDFLREAQTMASFDHKNIVKLMAVCTVGTPILIVMELMLLEDLKKFLITKRHLLHDTDCTQLKCTTPKGLTTMAHDVAMALSYLAIKKFVHRDVASRNCMVNSHGVVKLGDFGMARYMFSKGEYICERKALFPVRWMAPESLKDGTFTRMSDVWSYGILLYEIITFGSTPYKNIKDVNYVKEFVINGNIIRLPSGVNPHLKCLIEECWSYDDSRRPTAADIVVYLAERPTLLHPCLDDGPFEYRDAGPTAAMADTGETPTVLIDSKGCNTTDTSTFDCTVSHERKDSGYDPDELQGPV